MAQLLEFGLGCGVFSSVLLVCFLGAVESLAAGLCPQLLSVHLPPRLVCFVALLPDGLKVNQCVK